MKQFVISAREAGQRMDKYVFKVLNRAPRGFVYKMLRKKNIVLNEKKASGAEILQTEDVVKIYLSDETFAKFASALPEECRKNPVDNVRLETVWNHGCNLKCSEAARSDLPKKKDKRNKNVGAKNSGHLEGLQENFPISIVYEDADILAINKPAGMLSQKAKPGDVSANEYIIDYLLQSGQLTEAELRTFRPSICNRLDRNTSGLLVAGKTMRGLQRMAELLKTRDVKKFYRALVVGVVNEPRHLTGYLTKNCRTNQVEIRPDDRGDFIETAYMPVRHFPGATLLEVHLITGRSHQIRAHLSSIGHPVLGDPKYGDKKMNRRMQRETGIRRQLLHAYRMEFPDGKGITAEIPADFSVAIRWLKSFKDQE